MDGELDRLAQLRERTHSLLGQLWNSTQTYPPAQADTITIDDLKKASLAERVKVLGSLSPSKAVFFLNTCKDQY